MLLIIPLGRILIGAFEDGAGGFLDGLMRPEALHALMMTGLVVLVVTLLNTLFGIMMAITSFVLDGLVIASKDC